VALSPFFLILAVMGLGTLKSNQTLSHTGGQDIQQREAQTQETNNQRPKTKEHQTYKTNQPAPSPHQQHQSPSPLHPSAPATNLSHHHTIGHLQTISILTYTNSYQYANDQHHPLNQQQPRHPYYPTTYNRTTIATTDILHTQRYLINNRPSYQRYPTISPHHNRR